MPRPAGGGAPEQSLTQLAEKLSAAALPDKERRELAARAGEEGRPATWRIPLAGVAREEAHIEPDTPLIPLPKPDGKGVGAGIVRGAENVTESLTTPRNVAILAALGASPAVIARIAATGFGAQMLKEAPQTFLDAYHADTPGEKAELATEGTLTALMGAMSARHATPGLRPAASSPEGLAGRYKRMAGDINVEPPPPPRAAAPEPTDAETASQTDAQRASQTDNKKASPDAQPEPARVEEVSAAQLEELSQMPGLKGGAAGQAGGLHIFIGGKHFIFVDKDLSPSEKAEFIEHEQRHVAVDQNEAAGGNHARLAAEIVDALKENPAADPELHALIEAVKEAGYTTEEIPRELLAEAILQPERLAEDLAAIKAGKGGVGRRWLERRAAKRARAGTKAQTDAKPASPDAQPASQSADLKQRMREEHARHVAFVAEMERRAATGSQSAAPADAKSASPDAQRASQPAHDFPLPEPDPELDAELAQINADNRAELLKEAATDPSLTPEQRTEATRLWAEARKAATAALPPEEAAAREAHQAEMEAELRNAGSDTGDELLDAVRRAGGLPGKGNRHSADWGEELDRVRDAAKRQPALGTKGTFTGDLFRTDALSPEDVAGELRSQGFRVETPNDLFELIERRLRSGRPQYGTGADLNAEGFQHEYAPAFVQRKTLPEANPFGITAANLAPVQTQPLLHSTALEQNNPLGLRAAVKEPDGSINVGTYGEHHFSLPSNAGSEFGFVDKAGHFLSREEASRSTQDAKRFELAPPESVAEQRARLDLEKAEAKAKADREEIARRLGKPLEGGAGDLGQGDMFGGGDLFAKFARRKGEGGAATRAADRAKAERWWQGLYRLLGPGAGRQLRVLLGGPAELRAAGHTGEIPADAQAAWMGTQRAIYLLNKGFELGYTPTEVLNLLHESGHAHWDSLPKIVRDSLTRLWITEKSRRTGPLYRDHELVPGHAENIESDVHEWYAERVAHANMEWGARRLQAASHDGSLIGSLAAQLRYRMLRVRQSLFNEGADVVTRQMRRFMDKGAAAYEGGGTVRFARRPQNDDRDQNLLGPGTRWLREKATAAPGFESGGAGFKTPLEAEKSEPGAPTRTEDARLADRATGATSLPTREDSAGRITNLNNNPHAVAQRYPETKEIEGDNARVIGPALFAIRAHHGTSHEVVRFSIEKIGTGEGTQVYGWGLYFAEEPRVAEMYRQSLSSGEYTFSGRNYDPSNPWHLAAERIQVHNGNVASALAEARESLAEVESQLARGTPRLADQWIFHALKREKELVRILESGLPLPEIALKKAGNAYTVSLDVEPGDLLDWDKPLSEQSEKVKAALPEALASNPAMTGADLYQAFAKSLVRLPATEPFGKQASETLAGKGIPGIRYLDQGSRIPINTPAIPSAMLEMAERFRKQGKTVIEAREELDSAYSTRPQIERSAAIAYAFDQRQQTYNYVLFEDSKIQITHRNGEPVPLREAAADSNNPQDARFARRSRPQHGSEPIDADGERFGSYSDTEALRKKVRTYARRRFATQETIRNAATKSDILLGWQGVKHAIETRASEADLLAVEKLPELIASASFERSDPDVRGRSTIKAVHTFRNLLRIRGDLHDAEIVVRETHDGRFFYDHTVLKREDPVSISGDTASAPGSHQPVTGSAPPLPDGDGEGNALYARRGKLTPGEALLVGPMVPRDVHSLYEGAADRFLRTRGLEFLGRAIRRHVDLARALQGHITAPFRTWEQKFSGAEQRAAHTEFEDFQRQRDLERDPDFFNAPIRQRGPAGNARDSAALYRDASPAGKALIDETRSILDRVDRYNHALGVSSARIATSRITPRIATRKICASSSGDYSGRGCWPAVRRTTVDAGGSCIPTPRRGRARRPAPGRSSPAAEAGKPSSP